MDRVTIGEVEPDDGGRADRRTLAGPLGATDFACNHYRVPPDGRLPGGLHAHLDQEEVFVVLEGEATFTHYTDPDGSGTGEGEEVTVRAGEAVRFPPGEFQSGRNDADRDLVTLALGAPPGSDDVRIPVPCPACEHPVVRLDAGGEPTLACPDCGVGHVPAPCPDCGDERIEAALDDGGRPVVVCRGCGAAFDRPPVVGSPSDSG